MDGLRCMAIFPLLDRPHRWLGGRVPLSSGLVEPSLFSSSRLKRCSSFFFRTKPFLLGYCGLSLPFISCPREVLFPPLLFQQTEHVHLAQTGLVLPLSLSPPPWPRAVPRCFPAFGPGRSRSPVLSFLQIGVPPPPSAVSAATAVL